MIQLQIDGRKIQPFKAIVGPVLGSRTVLTSSPWGFVSLLLKRNKQNEALYFWNQAHEFHEASLHMSLDFSPLLHYYSFMNAAKALLTSKGISYSPYHGVKQGKQRAARARIALSNELVDIKHNGVIPALSQYFREKEPKSTHSLEDILIQHSVHTSHLLPDI